MIDWAVTQGFLFVDFCVFKSEPETRRWSNFRRNKDIPLLHHCWVILWLFTILSYLLLQHIMLIGLAFMWDSARVKSRRIVLLFLLDDENRRTVGDERDIAHNEISSRSSFSIRSSAQQPSAGIREKRLTFHPLFSLFFGFESGCRRKRTCW